MFFPRRHLTSTRTHAKLETGGRGAVMHSRTFVLLHFTIKDQKQSVVEDVERIRNHPHVPKPIPVYGFIYEIQSGKLLEAEAAKSAGEPAKSREDQAFSLKSRVIDRIFLIALTCM